MKVRVEVWDRYASHEVQMELDGNLFEKSFTPLDHPEVKADPMARTLCTSPAMIEMIMNDRRVLSKKISEAVTEMLMDILASKDTVMGYKTAKRIR